MAGFIFFAELVLPLIAAIVIFKNVIPKEWKVWWVGLIIALLVVSSWVVALMNLVKNGLA